MLLATFEILKKNDVLWRTGSKRKIPRPIAQVLYNQTKCNKSCTIEFLISSTTKFCETSTQKIRIVFAVLLEIPRPSQIHFLFNFIKFLPYFQYSNLFVNLWFYRFGFGPMPRTRAYPCTEHRRTEPGVQSESRLEHSVLE